MLDNEYRNGEALQSVQAASSCKRWRLAKRPAPAQLSILPDYYDVRKGPTQPFDFCDPYETSAKFSHDPTGQAVAGLYTVRFGAA